MQRGHGERGRLGSARARCARRSGRPCRRRHTITASPSESGHAGHALAAAPPDPSRSPPAPRPWPLRRAARRASSSNSISDVLRRAEHIGHGLGRQRCESLQSASKARSHRPASTSSARAAHASRAAAGARAAAASSTPRRSPPSARRTASTQLLVVQGLRQVVAGVRAAAPRARAPGRCADESTITRSAGRSLCSREHVDAARCRAVARRARRRRPAGPRRLRAPASPALQRLALDSGSASASVDRLAKEALVVDDQYAARASAMSLPIETSGASGDAPVRE